MNPELQDFYHKKPEPVKGCLLALRDIVLAQDDLVTETVKYGMPCFCYKKKMFCYLWTEKKSGEPYLLMVEGRHLQHPGLEKGNRSRMKIFRIDPDLDIPVDEVKGLLNEALDLYRTGKIKV
ncbi:DUF1801 domain-containing protein [Aquiflexum gelatinilyticum]|uniref:DUF1801 domain-containing protein n=1 Tax=Aquiflexum gelatinilyticum TaxID=2961943 RepID=A0A9X2SYT6_9BACT|nr:DUF1801 domain-containing protein [Aquiflexum gelatinilyticum]MCR9013608.1 DUF1801 domain-containing protein [Aquiflexum gelatinilyticum]